MTIWPVFGASNQLLAALTLLCITLWLLRNKRPALFAMLPFAFMMLISVWALIALVIEKYHAKNWILVGVSVLLLLLAFELVFLAVKALWKHKK